MNNSIAMITRMVMTVTLPMPRLPTESWSANNGAAPVT